jgi:predicted metalloprotease with PDZ domain
MAQVQATFDAREPETHLVRVTMRFPASDASVRTFRMPAWVPGSYKIRDFGRHVQDLEAQVGGRPVRHQHPTKDSWVVPATRGQPVTLTYRVYCRELTVDTSHVTADHAHLLPTTLAMYDEASRPLPHRVGLRLPRGWRAWSGLEGDALDGRLEAAQDYDHLIDCPIECGPPEDYVVRRFTARGRPHRHVVWRPPAGVDWARVDRDMRAVVEETVKVWGEAPYRHYTFLTLVAAEHGGGLEHRNSTALGADPSHLLSDDRLQTRFLPLVAHEFFHTWNVKRVLPAAFQPYDLQNEAYTDLLWLFEGFTSYYELPILHRAKVVGPEEWGKMVAEDLEAYGKMLGRTRLSVAQASRLAWTLLYQPFEHNVNRNVSYYAKGMWVALCLDAELRRRNVPDGLDAVMRHLWRKHGRTGVGVTDDAFPDIVQQATGVDLRARIEAWTRGTEELPIDRSLRLLGWEVKREWKDPKKRLGLGVEFKPGAAGGGPVIARIWEDKPAYKVLQPDDELVAALGYKWRAEAFAEQVAGRKAGEPVELTVFREGRLRTFQVPLAELPKDKVTVKARKGDAAAARRRKAWLGEGRPGPRKGTAKGGASPGRRVPLPPRGRQQRY